MPAYVQHHTIESAPVLCPGCLGLLPMYVRDVEPNWNLAKIDFIYECSDCGAEVRHTVTKPEHADAPAYTDAPTARSTDRRRHALHPLRALG